MKAGLERKGRGLYYDPATSTYIVRVMVNGRRVERRFDTRRQAEQVRLALKNQKVATDLGIMVPGSMPNVGRVMRQYIDDGIARGLQPLTVENYERLRKRLVEVLGPAHPIRLTATNVGEYVRERRRRRVSGRTIRDELSFLRIATRAVVGPAALTWSMPKLFDPNEAAPKPVPTDAQVAELYAEVDGHPKYRRLVLLNLLTALRFGDVRRLTDANLIDDCIVTGMHKRRGEAIVVPVVPTLAAALEGVRGHLAVSSRGTIESWLRRHSAGLSLKWYGTNILRHVASTWVSEAGFGDEQVGILLGHKVRSIARRHYIRPPAPQLSGPVVDLRRAMLETVEKRFLGAISDTKKSPNGCTGLHFDA